MMRKIMFVVVIAVFLAGGSAIFMTMMDASPEACAPPPPASAEPQPQPKQQPAEQRQELDYKHKKWKERLERIQKKDEKRMRKQQRILNELESINRTLKGK